MGRDIELLTLKFLDRFFHEKHEGIIENVIIPILNEESQISLRFIENFVTKYCRSHPVFIKLKNNTYIDIYDDYKNQLKSFDKKRFDIFKRKHSSAPRNTSSESNASATSNVSTDDCHLITYPCDKEGNRTIKTSIGQLNFFRWLIKTDILNYIIQNFESIKIKMSKGKRKFSSKINATNNASAATKSRKIEVV